MHPSSHGLSLYHHQFLPRPCGEDGECIPRLDYFTCRCRPGYRDELCSRGPPAFRGTPDSYLEFADRGTLDALAADPLDVNVRFKVTLTFKIATIDSVMGCSKILGEY